MKIKTLLIVAVIVLIVLAIIMLRPSNKQNTQMNNQKCPVSGQSVNDSHTYIHNGKEYKLCSDKCKRPLSENPDKYLSD